MTEEGRDEEEGSGREENPESGRGNKRDKGEKKGEEADKPTELPPTTRNWSIPELAKGEELIPNTVESRTSLIQSVL